MTFAGNNKYTQFVLLFPKIDSVIYPSILVYNFVLASILLPMKSAALDWEEPIRAECR